MVLYSELRSSFQSLRGNSFPKTSGQSHQKHGREMLLLSLSSCLIKGMAVEIPGPLDSQEILEIDSFRCPSGRRPAEGLALEATLASPA